MSNYDTLSLIKKNKAKMFEAAGLDTTSLSRARNATEAAFAMSGLKAQAGADYLASRRAKPKDTGVSLLDGEDSTYEGLDGKQQSIYTRDDRGLRDKRTNRYAADSFTDSPDGTRVRDTYADPETGLLQSDVDYQAQIENERNTRSFMGEMTSRLGYSRGGEVKGPAGIDKVPAILDMQGKGKDVPVALTEGEFVLPVKTVGKLGGVEALNKLVRATNDGKKPGGQWKEAKGMGMRMHAARGGDISEEAIRRQGVRLGGALNEFNHAGSATRAAAANIGVSLDPMDVARANKAAVATHAAQEAAQQAAQQRALQDQKTLRLMAERDMKVAELPQKTAAPGVTVKELDPKALEKVAARDNAVAAERAKAANQRVDQAKYEAETRNRAPGRRFTGPAGALAQGEPTTGGSFRTTGKGRSNSFEDVFPNAKKAAKTAGKLRSPAHALTALTGMMLGEEYTNENRLPPELQRLTPRALFGSRSNPKPEDDPRVQHQKVLDGDSRGRITTGLPTKEDMARAAGVEERKTAETLSKFGIPAEGGQVDREKVESLYKLIGSSPNLNAQTLREAGKMGLRDMRAVGDTGILRGTDQRGGNTMVGIGGPDAIERERARMAQYRQDQQEQAKMLDAHLVNNFGDTVDYNTRARHEAELNRQAEVSKATAGREKDTLAARTKMHDGVFDMMATVTTYDDDGNAKGTIVDPVKRLRLEQYVRQRAAERGVNIDALPEEKFRAFVADITRSLGVSDAQESAQGRHSNGLRSDAVVGPNDLRVRKGTINDAMDPTRGNTFTVMDYMKGAVPFTSDDRDYVVEGKDKRLTPLDRMNPSRMTKEELALMGLK